MKTMTTLGSLLLAAAMLVALPVTTSAAETAGDPDAKCLKCHSKKLKKKLEDGETMFLQISAEDFGQSVHQVIGCTGCHRDVAKGKHPSRRPIANRREYSLKHNETCSQCHAAKYQAYEGSVHASLVAEGSPNAPVCSDCHSSHSIQEQSVYEPVSGEPCSSCHEAIYDAYAGSVHGQAREHGNVIREAHVQAPICSGCHQAHEVKAVAASDYLRDTCLDCHETAAVAHEEWLPNAGMHLKSVSCAACHSPMAERRVDLQLYDKLTRMPVGQGEGDVRQGPQRHQGEPGLGVHRLDESGYGVFRFGANPSLSLRGMVADIAFVIVQSVKENGNGLSRLWLALFELGSRS